MFRRAPYGANRRDSASPATCRFTEACQRHSAIPASSNPRIAVGGAARPAAGGQLGSRPRRPPVAKIDLTRTTPPGPSSHANCSTPLEMAPTSGFAVSRELLRRAQSSADLHEPDRAPARRCHRSTCTGCLHAGHSSRVGCGPARRAERPAPGCRGNLRGATPCRSAVRRPARICHRPAPRPQTRGRGGRLDLAVCQGAILRGAACGLAAHRGAAGRLLPRPRRAVSLGGAR